MSLARTLIIAACLSLTIPASAMAQYQPPPRDPGTGAGKPGGKPATLRVCKQRGSDCFRTIQRAVRAARAGDVIKVSPGVYREGVQILGRSKRRIKLIGDRRRPERVVLEGAGLRGAQAQNGVVVNGANGVTVAGFKARNYRGNGFFAVNVDGYLLTDLIAERTGAYGVYAFNSKGGRMTDSEAYWNNDSGFYVGQTPPQRKPKRTIVRNVDAWGNVLGFSGTNMRYVTITKSRWFNNGLGIVPNSLDSEKFAPPASNVIVDNDVFWNNFNYYAGAPFELPEESAGLPAYPVGTGILLFGGEHHRVERNRVYGNWLVGFGAIQQVVQGNPTRTDPHAQRGILKGNQVLENNFGLGGADLNGRDMFYDGSGSGNCFARNTVLSPNLPADNSTFAACPRSGANALNAAAQAEALGFVAAPSRSDPASYEQFWIRHPHRAKRGIRPLIRCSDDAACRAAMRRGGSRATAAARKVVRVGDYFLRPSRLRVRRGATVVWRWPSTPGDQHDVLLTRGPRGVKKFHSMAAASDYSFSRKLTRSGRYSIICTLHPTVMRQRIRVG